MRRKEFEVEQQQEIEDFLQEMSFGFLGTVSEDGWPRVTPLNFVYHAGALYFHGSKSGEKMKQLANNPRVTFAVAKEYALIPSYFTDATYACPATAFFKSVLIKGIAHLVDNLEEKAQAFTAFMQKLQPEGGYAPFDLKDPNYAGQLKAVALVRIEIDDITAKFKFGQNLNEAKREQLTTGLIERQAPLDKETLELMEKYCPYHR